MSPVRGLPFVGLRKDMERAGVEEPSFDGLERRFATALEALRVSEIKYRGLADLIPQQVWTATPDGQLDYVNARVCAYVGQSAVVILGSGWLSVLHPEDVERAIEAW